MRKGTILTIFLLLALTVVGCTPAATTEPTVESQPITAVDKSGVTVTLSGPAQRIISLAPSNTEYVFAVGAGSALVGRDEYSNYPEEATSVQSIGDTTEINTELVVSLEPDLILAADITAPEQIQSLRDLGLTVFQVPNPTDFAGLYANLETMGLLTGKTTEAQTLVESLKSRVSAVEDKMKAATSTPVVFYELDSTDPTKPWTTGSGTFLDMLITLAGGKNLGAVVEGSWVQISSEEIITQNPQIIVLGSYTYAGTTPEDVAARAGWDVIQAVKDNTVYTFNDDLVSRPGPRMVDGLEELAKLIHPELFK